MAVYQIYKLLFNRSRLADMYSAADGLTAYDKAQELLEGMLQGGRLPINKEKRDKSLVPLENYVEQRAGGVTVLVVCNERNHKYREKMEEQELVYHPGCRVIIDNRPGVAQLAIERSSSFDGKTDTLCRLLQEALCKCFAPLQLTVEIRAKKREAPFWDVVEQQQFVINDPVKQVIYEFPDEDEVGPVDASRQVLDKLIVLQALNASLGAARGAYHAYSDEHKQIRLDRTSEDLAHMVSLCFRNGYNISVEFEHYGLYRFGSEIMAVSQLDDGVMKDFINGQTVMGEGAEPGFALVQWLDEIRKVTESYKDEEPVAKKRKRGRRYADAGQPDLGCVADAMPQV